MGRPIKTKKSSRENKTTQPFVIEAPAPGYKVKTHKSTLLEQLPIDMFCEIISYLTLQDVNNLRRTGKHFNTMFTDLLKDEDRDLLVWRPLIINQFPLLNPMCNPEYLLPRTKRFDYKFICASFDNKRRTWEYTHLYNNMRCYNGCNKESWEYKHFNKTFDATKHLYQNLYRIILKCFSNKSIGDEYSNHRGDDPRRLHRGANLATILGLELLVYLLAAIPRTDFNECMSNTRGYYLPDPIAIEKACDYGDTNIIKWAKQIPLYYDVYRCSYGAAEFNNLECFKLVADKNSDDNFESLLNVAVRFNAVEVVDYILSELKWVPTHNSLYCSVLSNNLTMINRILKADNTVRTYSRVQIYGNDNGNTYFTADFLLKALQAGAILGVKNLLIGNQGKPFMYHSKVKRVHVEGYGFGTSKYEIEEDSVLQPYVLTKEIIDQFFHEFAFRINKKSVAFLVAEYPHLLTIDHLAHSYIGWKDKNFQAIQTIIPLSTQVADHIENSNGYNEYKDLYNYLENKGIFSTTSLKYLDVYLPPCMRDQFSYEEEF